MNLVLIHFDLIKFVSFKDSNYLNAILIVINIWFINYKSISKIVKILVDLVNNSMPKSLLPSISNGSSTQPIK